MSAKLEDNLAKDNGVIKVTPVVLCGGSGTRLWPLSRSDSPKQFLSLAGRESLFQKAARRVMRIGDSDIHVAKPFIVTNDEHRFLVAEQLRNLGVGLSTVLLEPVGRNTAPAMTLAALGIRDNGEDSIMVVIPADQMIADEEAFTTSIQLAIREAASGGIVLMGIRPDHPATGYGYIQTATSSESSNLDYLRQPRPVLRFVEKPDLNTAQTYLEAGNYLWNSGIFVIKASVWLKALETFRPDIASACQKAWNKGTLDANFFRPGEAEFADIPSESADYAVMEHCPGSDFQISMIPLDVGWSDLGAWDSLWGILPKDENGNSLEGDVIAINSRNTLVHATSRLVSLVGVENIIVVETPDAVLVVDKTQSQEVKNIVNKLQIDGREEHILHRKVYRPWGWYDTVDEGERFKVKRIQVNPGSSLSLQMHRHRAEHWVVVRGIAEITNGDKTILLTENQSTFIPLGQVHRLANPGIDLLEIIEVQSGEYLGEDDIVRYHDTYGRA